MNVNTDHPQDRIETLRRELAAAFHNRADLYRLMHEELVRANGATVAEDVMTVAIERRGREVAAALFPDLGANDARAIGERFLAVSPDGGRLYPATVERGDRSIAFQVERCPLKQAWEAAGVAPETLETLCRIAGAFDRGLFEATGVRFENRTWTRGGGEPCCHIKLCDRDDPRYVD